MMTRESWMEVLPPTAMGHYVGPRGWFAPPPRPWTADENKQFERALAGLDLRRPDWDKVAHATGKTVVEVMDHFKSLELDVRQIESGMVPFPGYGPGAGGGGPAAAFTLQWDGSGGHAGAGDFRHGYRFGGCGGGRRHGGRTPEQERKKGVPWTEDEHKLFLLGLKKYGKGDWRNISRNFVQTRTPTQVASHAQKYFIRLSSGGGKDKRRSSIHDITTVHLTDDQPPSPSQSSMITQSSAPAPSSATGQFSLPPDTKQHGGANAPYNSPSRTMGMPSYGMGLQDQGLQCGPLHDQLAANRSMLY
ncbi:transcription factor DIVARICATA [Hordeum vulgare]|nr:transcription factor DIVARICATA [Hordeum vulgare]